MENKNQDKTQRKQSGSGKLKSLKRKKETAQDVGTDEANKVKGGSFQPPLINFRGFR